jgi:adenylyltransferase/sulfurtransferase
MTIFIPTPLRPFAGGKDAVEVSAGTVADALDELTQSFPDLRKHLFTEQGKLRAFVNVYLNDEDVRYLPAKEETAIASGDTLSIIPSIAGGSMAARARVFELER